MIDARQNFTKICQRIFREEFDNKSHVTDFRETESNETAFMELFSFPDIIVHG